MTRRRLFYPASVVLWAVLLAVVAKFSLDRLTVPPWGCPAGGEATLVTTEQVRIGQSFVAPLPGLYRIDITPLHVVAGGSHSLTFHLTNSPTGGQDIWSTSIAGDELQAGQPLSLEFSPLRDSEKKPYYFYLEAPGAASGTSVEFTYNPAADLDGASAYVDGQPVPGDLQFQTFYSLRTRDKLSLLLSRMAEGRPYLLGSRGFYIGLGLVYAFVLCVFIFLIARAILKESQNEP
jgi:hypothetical protein